LFEGKLEFQVPIRRHVFPNIFEECATKLVKFVPGYSLKLSGLVVLLAKSFPVNLLQDSDIGHFCGATPTSRDKYFSFLFIDT